MTIAVSPSQEQITTVLRSALQAILPFGIPIVAGQANRVAEPPAPDFVIFTTINRTRLSTNTDASVDGTTPSTTSRQSTQITIQIDVHGPASGDNVQAISTMLRSFFGDALIAATGVTGISFLYTSEPRQAPFINGANQYETRWSVDAVLQADQIVTTTAPALTPGFADHVTITPSPTR